MVPNPILKLDDITASKIAAGEVVEKPAMVVKELVENAIDAGSSKIIVTIEKGGKKRISVTDNGAGIAKSDLKMVFERHATSKIKKLEDLYLTSTLGFRGEALASISAVSEVTLITMTADDKIAAEVKARGGKLLGTSEIGALQGTTMTVENLFFNTPARLKFLKSDQAEGKRITELMSHLALSHPEISFHYSLEGRRIFQTAGDGKLSNVIFEVFDRDMIKNMFKIEHEALDIKLHGYASTFSYTKGNSTLQIAFVNGRYVRSDTVKEAIQLAYKPYLMQNRYAACICFLEITPSDIDVNIHPAKTEIKFHHEGDVKQVIYAALRKAFNLQNQIPSVKYTEKEVFRKPEFTESKINQTADSKPNITTYDNSECLSCKDREKGGQSALTPEISPETAPESAMEISKDTAPDLTKTFSSLSKSQDKGVLDYAVSNILAKDTSPQIVNETSTEKNIISIPKGKDSKSENPYKIVTGSKSVGVDFKQFDLTGMSDFAETVPSFDRPVETESIYDHLQYVGKFLNTYLLFEKATCLYIIDQHAAHEKIIYEQLMAVFRSGKVDTQLLLVPETLDFEWYHNGTFDEMIENLNAIGFDVDAFGSDTIVVRGIPNFISIAVARKLLTEILEGASEAVNSHLSETLMSKACKAAIKAHDNIAEIEIESMLEDLKTLKSPYTCPHGRPIIIELTQQFIEKKFKRIL